MTFDDIYITCVSWTDGYAAKFNAYHTRKSMWSLFDRLFIFGKEEYCALC